MSDLLRPQHPTRLLDIEQGSFATSFSTLPKYAILSHRWNPNELDYSKLSNHSQDSYVYHRRPAIIPPKVFVEFTSPYGNRIQFRLTPSEKFNQFCRVAYEKYGCRYVWMDSACIVQDDIEELDKSIFSMYWWYKNAYVCIVYLFDAFTLKSLMASSWFTRSWTLQELLAPKRLSFYYGDWTRVSECRFDVLRGTEMTEEHLNIGNFDPGPRGHDLRARVALAAGRFPCD
ncbi:hypothetical protein ONZ45_g17999 [Pleurotus djamor]|nr:hypothetical protein ONZ45_g17999 [Pleurotus djamor]